jgi:hypothetical protein
MADPERDEQDEAAEEFGDLDLDMGDAEDVVGGTGSGAAHIGPAPPGG